MKTQVINYSKNADDGAILYSKLSAPRSLDEFDINVIDLTDEKIWYNNGANCDTINEINDFVSINQMISNSTKTHIIIVLPQDIYFHYNKNSYGNRVNYSTIRIKDKITIVCQKMIDKLIAFKHMPEMIYENTMTEINSMAYDAAFFFQKENDVLTVSKKSNKATTFCFDDRLYVTSLNITKTEELLKNYLSFLFEHSNKEAIPEWMKQINFNDDAIHIEKIKANERIIEASQNEINAAQTKLEENQKYKSILYTSGDELVSVVFSILSQLLEYDLSDFIDKKREDFLIKKETFSLIGEIKGISSNVKNDNVTQLEVHYRKYLDDLEESGREENVHQVLIINPFRTIPINERIPVNEQQINLAKRNGSLIIETKTLLRMFEAFLQEKLTVAECERLFITKTGLLKEQDFIESTLAESNLEKL